MHFRKVLSEFLQGESPGVAADSPLPPHADGLNDIDAPSTGTPGLSEHIYWMWASASTLPHGKSPENIHAGVLSSHEEATCFSLLDKAFWGLLLEQNEGGNGVCSRVKRVLFSIAMWICH